VPFGVRFKLQLQPTSTALAQIHCVCTTTIEPTNHDAERKLHVPKRSNGRPHYNDHTTTTSDLLPNTTQLASLNTHRDGAITLIAAA
jgi:hypothetical protein